MHSTYMEQNQSSSQLEDTHISYLPKFVTYDDIAEKFNKLNINHKRMWFLILFFTLIFYPVIKSIMW